MVLGKKLEFLNLSYQMAKYETVSTLKVLMGHRNATSMSICFQFTVRNHSLNFGVNIMSFNNL